MSINYYINAFTKNSKQPKIPDGKMVKSIGGSVANTLEYQIPNNESKIWNLATGEWENVDSQLNTTYVVFQPNIVNSINVHSVTGEGGGDLAWTPKTFKNDRIIKYATTVFPDPQPVNQVHNTKTKGPETWREVSGALKIYSTQASEQVFGYYEAVSFALPEEEKHYQFGSDGEIRFTDAYMQSLEKRWENLRDDATYSSGSVSQLGDVYFQHVVNNPEHEPSVIKAVLTAKTLDNVTVQSADNTKAIDSVYDKNFLYWVIRIRSKKQGFFNFHYKLNIECDYPITDPINTFETMNIVGGDMTQVASAINNAHAPGARIIVSEPNVPTSVVLAMATDDRPPTATGQSVDDNIDNNNILGAVLSPLTQNTPLRNETQRSGRVNRQILARRMLENSNVVRDIIVAGPGQRRRDFESIVEETTMDADEEMTQGQNEAFFTVNEGYKRQRLNPGYDADAEEDEDTDV